MTTPTFLSIMADHIIRTARYACSYDDYHLALNILSAWHDGIVSNLYAEYELTRIFSSAHDLLAKDVKDYFEFAASEYGHLL